MENGQKSGMDFPQKGQVMIRAMPERVINLTRHGLSEAVTAVSDGLYIKEEPRPGRESMDKDDA